jgi:outer membrane protein assembly factor BamB
MRSHLTHLSRVLARHNCRAWRSFATFWLVLAISACSFPAHCFAQHATTVSGVQEASYSAGLGQWLDAIEKYQRIVETEGDELIPVPAPAGALAQLGGGPAFTVPWTSPRSLPARWICHEQISRFPPAALKLYRDRVDLVAGKRLETGRTSPDDRLLESILEDWFNSGPAETAILLLAQRSFDRADFHSAIHYWRLLLPGRDELNFPGPKTPIAAIRARVILAQLFLGNIEQARRDLQTFRAECGNASGLLAGRDGNFADTLEAIAKDPRQTSILPAAADGKEWSTFASAPSRDSLVSDGLPRLPLGSPAWRNRLPRRGGDESPVASDHPGSLAFHPVLAKGRAFVVDARHVYAFDLVDGKSILGVNNSPTIFDLTGIENRAKSAIPKLDAGQPTRDVRYTLTYADSFLYARMGSQLLRQASEDAAGRLGESDSAIVCLGPIPEKKAALIPLAWTLFPPKSDKESTAVFDGAPLVQDGKLFALVWRQSGGAAAISVVCYQVRGTDGSPELLWQREAGFRPAGNDRPAHDLLTLAGSNVVFCTNAGNIVALDALSGKPRWEYRYSRSERRPPPVGRDLCPCLFDGGHVFAAPADSDRLICLDAFTGRERWYREGVDVVHLVGVARNRLIATFAGPVKGIRGIAVDSGSESLPDGWIQHDDGGVATFGRGFVTPDLILWPTRSGMQFLRPEDGSPDRQPVPGMFGNLAYADDVFVVTTATEVIGYKCERKLIPELRRDVEKQPANKLLLYKLGVAEADAGQTVQALQHLQEAATGKPEPGDTAGERAARLAALLQYKPALSATGGKDLPGVGRSQSLVEIEGAFRLRPQVIDLPRPVHDPPLREPLRRFEPVDSRGPLHCVKQFQFVEPSWLLLRDFGDGASDKSPDGTASIWLSANDTVIRASPNRPNQPLLTIRAPGEVAGGFRHGNRHVLFGPRFLAAYDDASSKPAWCIELANLESMVDRGGPSLLRTPAGLFSGELTGFHRSGGTLYAIVNGRTLLAFDVENGTLRWCHWATSPRALPGPDGVVIGTRFFAGDQCVLLQLSSGLLRGIDVQNGAVRFERRSPALPWSGDPIPIDERTVIFSEGASVVVCLDPETGSPRWRHEIARPFSLIGAAPQLRLLHGRLLISVERNLGNELDALDPRTGERIWAEPLYLGIGTSLLDHIDGNATTLFVPNDDGVLKINAATGKKTSIIPLERAAGSARHTICIGSRLYVFPDRPAPTATFDLDRELEKLALYAPTPQRLQRILSKSFHALMDRSLLLLAYDLKDSRCVQQIDFPAAGLAAAVDKQKNGLMVITGSGIWRLTDEGQQGLVPDRAETPPAPP